jgi:Mrp family chromosome partitioning ATPase
MADESIELGYYSAVVRRHAVLVGIVAALGALFATAFLSGTTYRARSEVQILPIASDATSTQSDRTINTSTEQRIATSVAVAEIAAVELEAEPENLLGNLDVSVAPESAVLLFAYTSRNAERAVEGAQAFAEAYLRYRGESASDARADRIEELTALIQDRQQRLAEAQLVISQANSDDPPTRAEVAEAEARRTSLTTELAVLNESLLRQQDLRIEPGRVIGRAVNARASSLHPIMLLALGGGVGAVLGAVAAFVRDRMRARVNSPADLEAELGVPVLATIPGVARSSAVMVTRTEPHAPAAHAYRRLAVTLLAGSERQTRSVLLVGPTTTEPRTAVALNLAVALIQQGRRVLLVSADRHDPKIDRTFGLTDLPGLDEYLAGRGTNEPEEVLRGLHVLPAGTGVAFPVHHVPPPAAVANVVERGLRIADIVLVDAPPALYYPDVEVIGPIVDAVVVVAMAEETPRRHLDDLRARLALVAAPLRGAVLVQRATLLQHLKLFRDERRAARLSRAAAAREAAEELPITAPADEVAWSTAPPEEVVAEPAAAAAPANDDLTADAVALRNRIDALLRRHTSTSPSSPPPPAEPRHEGNGAAERAEAHAEDTTG